MVFSSVIFIFGFLPLTLIVYFLLKNNTLRNLWLLFISLVFFSWSQLNYLWIIVASIVLNYTSALLIDLAKSKNLKRFFLFIAVTCNLLLLFYFKYFDFSIRTVNSITGGDIPLKNIILPIGISFFTFQGMSYVIDVFKTDVNVQKNPLKVALYIVLFPQLIAGPIVRYKDIEKEIDKRETTIDNVSKGITRFIIGLSKKAIIANAMAEVADGIWDAGISNNTLAIAWLGSIAYSLQIFYDFSGYSDMAIGLGKMFGFNFLENFDRPYISKSITEFWRRWHISLSTWFRDYVYIPLGGNRKHLYRNLAIIFLLTGLWHGASWNFVLWGAWNGFFIIVERLLGIRKKSEQSTGIQKALWHIYSLMIINIGWVLFRAPTITEAIAYLKTMAGIGLGSTPGFTIGWYINNWVLFILLVAVVDIAIGFGRVKAFCQKYIPATVYEVSGMLIMFGLFITSVMRIMSGTYNPFIYFQF